APPSPTASAVPYTTLFRSLASPFTLGVSSAASFGASLAIVLGLGASFIGADWLVPLNAFVFAFGSVLALQALARMKGSGIESIRSEEHTSELQSRGNLVCG